MVIAVCALAMSCQEYLVNEEPWTSSSIDVRVNGGTQMTKAGYNDAVNGVYSMFWNQGDKIQFANISDNSNVNTCLTAQSKDATTVFSGKLNTWQGASDVVAVFPYNAELFYSYGAAMQEMFPGYRTFSGNPNACSEAVYVVLPNTALPSGTVSVTPGTAASNGVYVAMSEDAIAESQDRYMIPNLTFHQVSALIDANITGYTDPVNSISIRYAENANEEGLFKHTMCVNPATGVETNDTDYRLTSAEMNYAVVRENGDKGNRMYLPVFPADLAGKNMEIWLTRGDCSRFGSNVQRYKYTRSGIAFERNKIYTLNLAASSATTSANPTIAEAAAESEEEGLTLTYSLPAGTVSATVYVSSTDVAGKLVSETECDSYDLTINGTTGSVFIEGLAEGKYFVNCLVKTAYWDKWVSQTVEHSAGAVVYEVRYELVKTAPSDWSGTYLVVNTDRNGTGYAWNATNTAGGTVAVKIQNGIINDQNLGAYELTATPTGQKYSDGSVAYDIRNSNNKYVYCSSSAILVENSNKHKNGGTEYTYAQNLSMSGTNKVKFRSGQMKASTSSNNFYYLKYASSKYSYNKTSTNTVCLYKKVEVATFVEQNLSFAAPTVTWEIGTGGSYSAGATYQLPQTVSGARTNVTYSSSNTAVATIVNNSQIRINGEGSTVITATAEQAGKYASATASFTLTVKDVSPIPYTNLGTFNLVNSTIDPYLTKAAATYTDSWSTGTIVNQYPNGEHGDLADQNTYRMGDSRIKAYDRPAPVPIPVKASNGSTVTVSVYNNSAKSDLEYALTTTVQNGNVDFYNLIPGRTYYYSVTSAGNLVGEGQFNTTGTRRFMKVSDNIWADCANNCRDLGGLNTVYNKPLKYNLLFRGSNMNATSDAEKAYIKGYMNVKMDIDLRKSGGTGIDYVKDVLNVGFCGVGFTGGSDLIASGSRAKIKTVFTNIINTVKAGNAAYIHCFAGADRTGYVCCLLEAVLGVSEKDCSIDYELTSFSCVCVRDRTFKLKVGAAMQTCYPYINSQSGSTFQAKAVNILKAAGITDSQIEDLREAMIEGYVRQR